MARSWISRHEPLVWLWLVASLLTLSRGEVTCEKDSKPCQCKLSDGSGTVDLTDLNNNDRHPYFKGIKEESGVYFFDVNPCTGMDDPFPAGQGGDCDGVSVCQYTQPKSGEKPYRFDCGDPNPVKTVVNGKVQFFYEGKDQAGSNLVRTTTITIICEEGTKGDLSTFTESPSGSGKFKATLKTKLACFSGGGSSGSGGLSIGSILLIVFFALIIVYFVAGILIMKYVKGAESVPEMIPNKPFWTALPGLVKDGCVLFGSNVKGCCSFAYGKITGRGYQEV